MTSDMRDIRGSDDVQKALHEVGHSGSMFVFDATTESAEAAARELEVPVSRIVKSMLFVADKEPVLVLLPGDRRVDLNALAAHLGAKKVRLAFPGQVQKFTGYPVGAVPPVGHSHPVRIILDEALCREGPVYPAAGERNNAFETTFDRLLKMTRGAVAGVSGKG